MIVPFGFPPAVHGEGIQKIDTCLVLIALAFHALFHSEAILCSPLDLLHPGLAIRNPKDQFAAAEAADALGDY